MVGVVDLARDLPTWGILAVTLAAAYRLTRGGGGAAVAELDRSNRVLTEALHAERQAHQATKDRMGAEVRDLRVQVATLEAKTDVAAVMQGHEERAQERHVKTLQVLELIAARLGRDDG